ncbi:TetR/AcrR family transcriptional regulator [Pseudonocardia spinosispora]|uniref:TetR/AcrR family transcriptional regulator n=1 Tax=Pseudonocardia spinosispora TaxID=103441 RepID=UPI0003F8E835|nr:TetR/AcrR family transcriptional regulator [Pseudonocardia spinosispora]
MDGSRRAALDQLSQVPPRLAALERSELTLIAAARGHGGSWTDIADALGLRSRQAAEQRFRRLSERVGDDAGSPLIAAGPAPTAGLDTAEPHPRPRSEGTRLRILDAAAQVLAERGYASTRISDIAARAQLRAGSVYHHFPSKDELIEEVLRFGVTTTHRRVHQRLSALPDDAAPIDRLAAAMAAHLQTMIELDVLVRAHTQVYGQLPDAMRRRVRTHRLAYGALWSDLIGAAIEDGALRDDIHRYLIRLFVVNSIEAASQWAWRAHRTTGELTDAIRRLILDGASAPVAGNPH